MTLTQTIPLLCWLAFLFYWAVNAWNVKPAAETVRSNRRFRIVAVVGIIIFISTFHDLIMPVLRIPACAISSAGCNGNSYTLPFHWQIIGDILSLTGVAIAIIARRTLGTNWSASVQYKKHHTLVTTGIYSYVRHPIYTGMFTLFLGTLLLFPTPVAVVTAVITTGGTAYKIRREEQLMMKHFPREYPEYKKRVKALIPWVF